jgi:metal-dependent HD superfamily phosphatase/phosphodiesterase
VTLLATIITKVGQVSLVFPVSQVSLLQVIVSALHVHQLAVRALLRDAALVDVADDVSADDGRQAVCNDDGRAARLCPVKRLLHVLHTPHHRNTITALFWHQ